MRTIALAALLMAAPLQHAWGWGADGHAITAEIAQRHLTDAARQMVDKLLKHGTLASVASWADDVKFTTHKQTRDWHFVDIPLNRPKYDPAKDCKDGNCVIGALDTLKNKLRCGKDDAEKIEALKFVTHFIGDLHQPLHTVLDGEGFNKLTVTIGFCGPTNKSKPCKPSTAKPNFHEVWDETLIGATVFAWGSYVDNLERSWPKEVDIAALMADSTGPIEWAEEAHVEANVVRKAVPKGNVLRKPYYDAALPVLDRQLARGGIRLAKFLNAAYGSNTCPTP